MSRNGAFSICVTKSDHGQRLDALVASHLSDCSRSFAAHLISNTNIRVDGQPKKPGYRVKTGDNIKGQIPAPEPIDSEPEPIEIDRLYEDKHLIVINKPPGLVVHPAPGHYSGTLVNALLYHCPDLKGIGGALRPGIVHRLDKDTSGALVVAKSAEAHEYLARQFKARTIQKTYLSLVYGEFDATDGTIRLSIGRHPTDRKRMSTKSRKRREAETQWNICEQFKGITLLELHLKTGRTHQIRVHCAAMDHPIVGDPVYRPRKLLKNITKTYSTLPASMVDAVKTVKRQMLHAWRLGFNHPKTGEKMVFEAPMPRDMEALLIKLRDHKLR
jgi:23S rRNA pseudouridine1911/1915/1917 synthase